MTAQKTTPELPRPRHLGELVRLLREAADLTRDQMAQAVGIAPATLRNFETWRHRPTLWTLRRLLQHPALAQLPELAKEAGLVFDRDGLAAPNQGQE